MKTMTILLTLSMLAAASVQAAEPAKAPAEVDLEYTVDRMTAEDFAREALAESSDRPIVRQQLVVRTHEGAQQLFWEVKLAGSWKTAFVFANGEQEGVTLVVDDRAAKKPGT